MDMISFIIVAGASLYIGARVGAYVTRREVGSAGVDAIIARTKFPVGVAEKIDGQYYMYEKDTSNFMCQAPTLEELPAKLLESKNISLAVLLCPEETNAEIFWCVNGKLKTVNL